MEVKCEVCGSRGLQKREGAFVCPQCGTEYPLEEVQKILAKEAAGTGAQAPQEAKTGKKRMLPLILILAGLAIAAVLFVVIGLPRIRYIKASSLLNSGDYEGAIQAFTALGDYGDSKALVEIARERQAEVQRERQYARAEELFAQGDYEGALELYAPLVGCYDVDNTILEAKYRLAVQLLEKGEYARARRLLKELGTYMDSQKRLPEAKYGEAEALLAAGDYEGALTLLQGLDHPDAKALADRCSLEKGKALFAQGQYEAAYLVLFSLTDSEEAMQYAANCAYEMQMTSTRFEKRTMDYVTYYSEVQLYILGQKAFDGKRYTYAVDLLKRCLGYADSVSLCQAALLMGFEEGTYANDRERIWTLYNIANGVTLQRIAVNTTQAAVPYAPAQARLQELAAPFYEKGAAQAALTNWGSALKQLNVIKGIDYLDTDALITACDEAIQQERSAYNGVWREHTHFWTNLKIVDGVVYYSTDQTSKPKKTWSKLSSTYNEDTGELTFTYMSYRYKVTVSGSKLTIKWINQKDKRETDWFGSFTKFDLTPGWS